MRTPCRSGLRSRGSEGKQASYKGTVVVVAVEACARVNVLFLSLFLILERRSVPPAEKDTFGDSPGDFFHRK